MQEIPVQSLVGKIPWRKKSYCLIRRNNIYTQLFLPPSFPPFLPRFSPSSFLHSTTKTSLPPYYVPGSLSMLLPTAALQAGSHITLGTDGKTEPQRVKYPLETTQVGWERGRTQLRFPVSSHSASSPPSGLGHGNVWVWQANCTCV